MMEALDENEYGYERQSWRRKESAVRPERSGGNMMGSPPLGGQNDQISGQKGKSSQKRGSG